MDLLGDIAVGESVDSPVRTFVRVSSLTERDLSLVRVRVSPRMDLDVRDDERVIDISVESVIVPFLIELVVDPSLEDECVKDGLCRV